MSAYYGHLPSVRKATNKEFNELYSSVKNLSASESLQVRAFIKPSFDALEKEKVRRDKIKAQTAAKKKAADKIAKLKMDSVSLSPMATHLLAVLLQKSLDAKSRTALNLNANDKGSFSATFFTPLVATQAKSLDETLERAHKRLYDYHAKFPTPHPDTIVLAEKLHRLIMFGHIAGLYTSFHWEKKSDLTLRFGARKQHIYYYDKKYTLEQAIDWLEEFIDASLV
jgi:hypothetical protein